MFSITLTKGINILILILVFALSDLRAQENQKPDSLDGKAGTKATIEEMLKKIPGSKGEQYATAMKHGTLHVLIYSPKEIDTQKPHDKDEVYVVLRGTGTFFDGTKRNSFKAGDVLFVPAKTEHRFENFTNDFVTWVIFYGPDGGEK